MYNHRTLRQYTQAGTSHSHHVVNTYACTHAISGIVVFIRRVTYCFVPATDEDNPMVVKMFGIVDQVLASGVH